jgi:SHS2 domain-containing protein
MPEARSTTESRERLETFAHGSDIGVRGIGASAESAFEQAARALTSVVTDVAAVEPRQPVEIAARSEDREVLLVDFLNALIFEMASRRMVFGRFEVRIRDGALAATAWGEPVDVARHRPVVEPKGATFTRLSVRQGDDGAWAAQCVIDV